MTGRPTVTAVVVNWNNYDDTAACLDSLADADYPALNVVVVDNGSTDDSGERIEREYHWCTVLFTGENLGFARGNNVGIDHAMADGTDHILLLNNDTIVEPDFLGPLVDAVERDAVAMASSVVYDDAGDIWYAGGHYSRWQATGDVRTTIADDVPYEADFVFGAMALLDGQFVAESDVLPAAYFFGVEDMDVSLQARLNGWRILVVPDSEIIHKVAASAGSARTPFRVYHELWGRLHLAMTRLPFRQRLTFALFFSWSRPIVFAKWLHDGHSEWVRASLWAVQDFLTEQYPRDSMVG